MAIVQEHNFWPYPEYKTFRKIFRKYSGKTPETLSEFFLQFPSRVRLGTPHQNPMIQGI